MHEFYLQNPTSFFVDEPRNPFDAAPPGQTSDGGLGDSLDVVTKNLPVSLGSSLPQALATFPTSTHYSLSNSNLQLNLKLFSRDNSRWPCYV